MNSPIIQYEKISSQGHKIALKIRDNGKSSQLLMVHGFNDSKDTFVFLEEFLSEYFNLIAFDLRGHGDSEWKPDGLYNYSETLLDLHTVVSQFLPGKFSILGHSLGAGLSARYCGLNPENIEVLICLEGFSGLQPQERERIRILEWLNTMAKKKERSSDLSTMRRGMKKEDAIQKLGFIYQGLDKEKVKVLVEGLIRETENGFVWKNDPRIKNTAPIPFPPELSRTLWANIKSPVILFFGEKSHIRPDNLEEIKSHFSSLTHIEVPNAGHNMQHDNPEFLIEKLKPFLDKHIKK